MLMRFRDWYTTRKIAEFKYTLNTMKPHISSLLPTILDVRKRCGRITNLSGWTKIICHARNNCLNDMDNNHRPMFAAILGDLLRPKLLVPEERRQENPHNT